MPAQQQPAEHPFDVVDVHALPFFLQLSQVMNADLPFHERVSGILELTRQVLHAEFCIFLFARDREFTVSSHTALVPSSRLQGLPVKQTSITHLQSLRSQGKMKQLSAYGIEHFNPLQPLPEECVLLATPLLYRTELLGLLNCYWQHTPQEEVLPILESIGNLLALALMQDHTERLLRKTQAYVAQWFFDELLGTSENKLYKHALFLDIKRDQDYVVVLFEHVQRESVPDEEDNPFMHMRTQLEHLYHGSLFSEQEHTLIGLLPARDTPDVQMRDEIQTILQPMHSIYGGLSTPCRPLDDFRRAYNEAKEALNVPMHLSPDGGVAHFGEVSILTHIAPFVHPQGPNQVLISEIVRDRDGRRLLTILTAYLAFAGNETQTSEYLQIDRGTVQRALTKMEKITKQDFGQLIKNPTTKIELEVALQVYLAKTRSNNVSK